jgi:LuxR family maltose regulon positive regulatory protein
MLKTKINKPKPSSKLIFRKELIDKLENVPEKKLILVSAPAGYGKSTLLSQWLDSANISTSWYSLDKSDNDIATFLKYTIASIQTCFAELGSEAIKLMESNTSPSPETIGTCLLNDFYEIEERFTLVFDDYHLIENMAINDFIYFLLSNLPEHIQIVLITRSDPAIPLARMRSQQMITDIRLDDLCFNAQNIHDFFKTGLNIQITEEDAKNLESKTEGWVAGLQLAGLSMQGKDDFSEFVNRLKGDNRYIMDYLIEEVLQRQDEDYRNFLLFTSILNRFNASICNHLLNIGNAQEIIEQLERDNMFIIPLDNERNWFRYHHLFADLLQQRLSVKFKSKIPELHTCASHWFEENNQLVFALEHSLAGGDKSKALELFAVVIEPLWMTSQYRTILQFGAQFSFDEITSIVNLCFNYFWILFQSGFTAQSEQLIKLLQNRTTERQDLSKIYVCINMLKVFTGDIEASYQLSDLSLQYIKEDEIYWKILAFLSLGETHLLKFELEESVHAFEQAVSKASATHFLYFKMINRTRAAFVLWIMGDYSGSDKAAKELLDEFEQNSDAIELLSAILLCQTGNYLINTNQVDSGLKKSLHGYNLSKNSTNPVFIATCSLLLAESYFLAGDYKKALIVLDELDGMPYKQNMKFLSVLSDSLKSRLHLLTNQRDKLKQYLKNDIPTDENHTFERIYHSIDKARYQIENGEKLKALDSLRKISFELYDAKALGLLTTVEILQAKAHYLLEESEEGVDYLMKAVVRTQRSGLIRIYINEGHPIEDLLKEIKTLKESRAGEKFKSIDTGYINKILRVFEKEKTLDAIHQDDKLSSREMETLKLVAENLSNQEIADVLYISITTVKTHVRNILLKLDAKNRNVAVAKAREKGILPS